MTPITLAQLAAREGVSRARAYQWAELPGFPRALTRRKGPQVFSLEEVDAWVREYRSRNPQPEPLALAQDAARRAVGAPVATQEATAAPAGTPEPCPGSGASQGMEAGKCPACDWVSAPAWSNGAWRVRAHSKTL